MFKHIITIIQKIMCLLMIAYIVFSMDIAVNADLLGDMQSDMSNFKELAKEKPVEIDDALDPFKELGQILTMVGAGVMVAVTLYMGIKYLTSGPDAQAKLKTQLIGLVVSGVVIFGAYSIWKMVVTLAASFDE